MNRDTAAAPVIAPTVGRVVHFFPHGAASIEHAAIIAAVNEDGTVNLAWFQHDGLPAHHCNVRIIPAGEPDPELYAFARWMPYQLGQAAKTEAAERRAAQVNPA